MAFLIKTLVQPFSDLFQLGCSKPVLTKTEAELAQLREHAKIPPLSTTVDKFVREFIRFLGVDDKAVLFSQSTISPNVTALGSLKHWKFTILDFNSELAKEMNEKLQYKHLYLIARAIGFLAHEIGMEGEFKKKQASSQNGLITFTCTALASGAAMLSQFLPCTLPVAAGSYLASCAAGQFIRSKSNRSLSKAQITSIDRYVMHHCQRLCIGVPLLQTGIQLLEEERKKNLELREMYLSTYSAITTRFSKSSLWNCIGRITNYVIGNHLISSQGDDLTRDSPSLKERIAEFKGVIDYLKIPASKRQQVLEAALPPNPWD